jgi:hypothetical protein
MVPGWLTAISSFAPFLLLISVGVIVFGIARLRRHLNDEREDREEEEAKRQEFIRSMNQKIQDKKLMR